MSANEESLRNESQAALINSLSVIFVAFSTIAVVLRIYTRHQILSVIGADDVSIAVAQVLAIAVSVTTCLEVYWGLGRHTQFVHADDATNQLKSLYANIMIYNASQIVTKISFLILYRRLFPGPNMQRVCLWLLMFIIGWGIVQEFIVGFSCIPLTAFLPSMAGKCIPSLPVWYLTSSMNIVTDFMIFLIPVFPVVKLQMGSKQKGMLLGLFCLGFFTCIISCVRLSTLHKGIHTQDPFWDNAPAAYWSVVELNCGILCACLPTLRPLIQRVIPRLLSTVGATPRTGTAISHKFSTIQKGTRGDAEEGIYIRKDIELHSTVELTQADGGYPPSLEESQTSFTANHGAATKQQR